METKLYVGNLAYATTEAEIRHLFAKAGRVIAVELIKDKDSGKSKGFAFVTMSTPAEAQAAIGLLHASSLAGRDLTVNVPRKPETPAGNQRRYSAAGTTGQGQKATGRKPTPAPGGYQSRYSAAGTTGQGQKATGRKPTPAPGGYQSRYSAFGENNNSNSSRPRRRGGNQRP